MITNKVIKLKLSDRLHTAWNERWLAYPETRQSKIWILTAKSLKTIKLMDRQMIRYIIGPFRHHQQFSDKEVDKTCSLCAKDEE